MKDKDNIEYVEKYTQNNIEINRNANEADRIAYLMDKGKVVVAQRTAVGCIGVGALLVKAAMDNTIGYDFFTDPKFWIGGGLVAGSAVASYFIGRYLRKSSDKIEEHENNIEALQANNDELIYNQKWDNFFKVTTEEPVIDKGDVEHASANPVVEAFRAKYAENNLNKTDDSSDVPSDSFDK